MLNETARQAARRVEAAGMSEWALLDPCSICVQAAYSVTLRWDCVTPE